jgi:hypothetical protein
VYFAEIDRNLVQTSLFDSPSGFLRGNAGFTFRFLGLALPAPHGCIPATSCQELVVGASLDDFAGMQNNDLVRVRNCRQAVTIGVSLPRLTELQL